MAAESRQNDSVIEPSSNSPQGSYAAVEVLLHTVPQEFDFFQAVRLLERILPARSPVGRFDRPEREVVRFSAHASFPFPASQIQRMDWTADRSPRMVINFMGLAGPSGVLPLYYTELIVERIRAKDRTLAEFFDIFNHRMISFFYQAWEKYHFAVSYEREERDRLSQYLMDLIGIGTRNLQGRLEVRDDALLFYTGLLGLHTRSAAALERVLSDYFAVPVEVEQFTGSWQRLHESDYCQFSQTAVASEQLGLGAVVGDEVWNKQSGVRVKLGPLDLAQYLDFLPSGTAYRPLHSLARFVARHELDLEFQLILKRDDVPGCALGAEGEVQPRLGWTSWAKTQPMQRDPADTILRA